MPIPKPKEDEKENEFISRCMSDEIMNKEYPDQKQRAGVCYSQWREKDKMADDERGTGKGVGNDPVGDGGASICVCPDCKNEMAHIRGRPCNEHQCSKCGAYMVGK